MGFEEQLMRLKPEPDVEEAPGQFWKDFIHDTAPEFRKSTFEQIETLIQPIWSELISGSIYATGRLTQIFGEVRPDVIVQDNVVAFAPVVTAGTPWVRIVSCNPLEVSDPALPPALSGLPAGDRSGWERFSRRVPRCACGLASRLRHVLARPRRASPASRPVHVWVAAPQPL